MDNLSDKASSDGSDLSETSSTTSALHASILDGWANSVGLDPTIRENGNLPVALRDIVRASETVPRWILNEKAPEYKVGEIFCTERMYSAGTPKRFDTRWNSDLGFYGLHRAPKTSLSASGSNDEVASQNFGYDAPVGFSRLLHWVIEYECEKCSNRATRKVLQGMVSGLYQRRALGFLDHIVFWHSSPLYQSLDVLTATWEIPDPSTTNQNVNWICIPGMDTEEAEGDEIFGNEGKSNGSNHEQSDYSSSERMIVVYRLGTFDTGTFLHMLQFYLLMRSTRILGLQYKTGIMNAFPTSTAQQPTPVESDELSAALRSPSPSESNRSGRKRQRLREPGEEEVE